MLSLCHLNSILKVASAFALARVGLQCVSTLQTPHLSQEHIRLYGGLEPVIAERMRRQQDYITVLEELLDLRERELAEARRLPPLGSLSLSGPSAARSYPAGPPGGPPPASTHTPNYYSPAPGAYSGSSAPVAGAGAMGGAALQGPRMIRIGVVVARNSSTFKIIEILKEKKLILDQAFQQKQAEYLRGPSSPTPGTKASSIVPPAEFKFSASSQASSYDKEYSKNTTPRSSPCIPHHSLSNLMSVHI